MSISISNESKNSLTVTNTSKDGTTWDEATFTWNEADGTWDVAGLVVVKESKNSLTVTAESKT